MIRHVIFSADAELPLANRLRTTFGWNWSFGLARLQQSFPSVIFQVSRMPQWVTPRIVAAEWHTLGFDFRRLDEEILRPGALAPAQLNIVGEPNAVTATIAGEILTRYQAMIQRTNRASRRLEFKRLLARHRDMHELGRPLVLAEYLHSLDTWQWVLRLKQSASFEVQVAALFHDIERLAVEPERRVEHHPKNHQDFRAADVRRGAAMVSDALADMGLSRRQVQRIAMLGARHAEPISDPELVLLNDADSLSFFSLDSARYLDSYGEAQTANKIAHTLKCMQRSSIALLKGVRFRGDVERLVVQQLQQLRHTHKGHRPRQEAFEARQL